MKVCGVELKGNDAVICLLSLDEGLFDLPSCRVSKISIVHSDDASELQQFQYTFSKLIADYKVDKVVIRQRPTKGKFAGGHVGFKLEAAIQLADVDVVLLSTNRFKESLKNSALMIDFRDTGLKKFQEPAFNTAYGYLSL
jgi:hypothetical protein